MMVQFIKKQLSKHLTEFENAKVRILSFSQSILLIKHYQSLHLIKIPGIS